MRHCYYLLLALCLLITTTACKKDRNKMTATPQDCQLQPTAALQEEWNNVQASLTVYQGQADVIITRDDRDSRVYVIPCNLPGQFRVDNLRVTITGKVYAGVSPTGGPSAIGNLSITEITER